MNPLTPQQNEQLRHAVREILTARQGAAFPVHAIVRRIKHEMLVDFPFDEENASITLQFLAGLTPPQTKSATEPLGSTLFWMITSDGVLAHERRGQR